MRVKKFMPVAVVIILLLAAALVVTALAESALGITEPCYTVLSPTGSVTSMAVTWWDAPEVSEAQVRYGAVSGLAEYETASAVLNVTDAVNGYSSFEATMTGLSENTTYYYSVGHGDVWSAERSFKTETTGSSNVSFMYMGDIQYSTYTEAENDYAVWGTLLQNAYSANPDLDFAVMGGDMVQQGQTPSCWQMFLKNATGVYSSVPMLAAPGNHESNGAGGKPVLFKKLFSMPKNGPTGFEEEFYSYDCGNVHVTCLSSNVLSGEQISAGSMTEADYKTISDWIAADLAASSATWKVVIMHHPAYTVVTDEVAAAVLENWEPIFAEQQVDLVLCGHQHIYMRTKAIKGVTYVMGNSGSQFYAGASLTYAKAMIANVSTYQLVKTSGSTMTLETYNTAGELLDSVSLAAKDRSVTPVWADGDLDGDGTVTQADVAVLMNAVLNRADYDSDMDWNNDGRLDICDVQLIAMSLGTE